MHFKRAIIVCAVYFLTLAWSVEINIAQLNEMNKLFNNPNIKNTEVKKNQIIQFMNEHFKLEEDVISYIINQLELFDSMNLLRLLQSLATIKNKSSEKIKDKALTSMELHFYLEEFDILLESVKKPGCLTPEELLEAFKYWKTLNSALKAKLREIKTNKDCSYEMNAVDFLLIIIEIKPIGIGLTIAHIEKFGVLYDSHKTPDGIDPEASKQVFKEIGIKIEEDLTTLFEQRGPPGILLMDLIIAATERNILIDENEWRVLSTWERAPYIRIFKELDGNIDGVLSPVEYAESSDESVNELESMKGTAEDIEKANFYLNIFDGRNTINFAEYLGNLLFTKKLIKDQFASDSDSQS